LELQQCGNFFDLGKFVGTTAMQKFIRFGKICWNYSNAGIFSIWENLLEHQQCGNFFNTSDKDQPKAVLRASTFDKLSGHLTFGWIFFGVGKGSPRSKLGK
jgi:hypothetical protein